MVKRILDLNSSDILNMERSSIIESIKGAEGRTLVSEIIGTATPLLDGISNVELASAFGADMLILNMYDVDFPIVKGLPQEEGENVINDIKKLTGRLIGINLEPIDLEEIIIGERQRLTQGRLATVENVKKAIKQGINFIVLTGNPQTGVSNKSIIKAVKNIRREAENILIFAGKMHSSGSLYESSSKIIDDEVVEELIDSGSDGILLPAPGTIPGITVDYLKKVIDFIHQKGVLAMTTVGTSQEGADLSTIRSIALNAKMAGADIHHIGDSGFMGIALPENIMGYSIAIRGKRHTYKRMARSINR